MSGSEIAVAERVTPAGLLARSRDRLRVSEYDAAMDLASQAAAGDDPLVRAEALSVLATCRRLRDEYPEALELALRAAEAARDLNHPAAEARARSEIARALLSTGETDEALLESLSALELAEVGGDLR